MYFRNFQDFDEYIRLFKMLDEYENGTLSRHHWALEMHDERFSQFFKNRMAEVCGAKLNFNFFIFRNYNL